MGIEGLECGKWWTGKDSITMTMNAGKWMTQWWSLASTTMITTDRLSGLHRVPSVRGRTCCETLRSSPPGSSIASLPLGYSEHEIAITRKMWTAADDLFWFYVDGEDDKENDELWWRRLYSRIPMFFFVILELELITLSLCWRTYLHRSLCSRQKIPIIIFRRWLNQLIILCLKYCFGIGIQMEKLDFIGHLKLMSSSQFTISPQVSWLRELLWC